MSNNGEVTTTETKPLYLQHCSRGSRDFKGCYIQSEASLQPNLPSVTSPSTCAASDSLATIYNLCFVEAVGTAGSSRAKNGRREAETDKQREAEGFKESWTVWLGKAILSWAWLGYLDWAGCGLGLSWSCCWFGRSKFSARIKSSIHTHAHVEANKETLRVRAAHNPVRRSWLRGHVVWCHSCELWGTVT